MPTLLDFRTRFPELVSISDEMVNLSIADAVLLMETKEKWLDFYEVACLYLAANLAKLAELVSLDSSGSANYPVKRQEVDDVVVENAVTSVGPYMDSLVTTAYGQRYFMYLRMCFAGMRVI